MGPAFVKTPTAYIFLTDSSHRSGRGSAAARTHLILRIGGKGNEEDFLDRPPPKQTDDLLANAVEVPVSEKSESLAEGLTPKRDGELFIYLNKPVLGLWGYESLVSDWIGSTGKAKVTIEK
jgi:hypothetical protein